MNIFSENPIRLFVKGFDDEKKFITKAVLIFLNVPDDIYKEVISVDKKFRKSAKLEKYFGKNWQSKLNINQKHGGQETAEEVAMLEELLDEEIPEDIFGVEDILEEMPVKEDTKLVLDKETAERKNYYINDVFIFPEDRVSEFKDKVHIATNVLKDDGIPMFRQHMFILRGDNVIPVSYKTTIDGIVNIDIRHLYENVGDQILDIPIDNQFNQGRDEIRIEAFEELRTMEEMFNISSKFYVVDLEEFISPNRRILSEIARTDAFRLEMLYYGFIIKYFPQLSLGAFKDFLDNEIMARANYPQLFRNYKTLQKKYYLEAQIINSSYKTKELETISKQIDIGIRSATITVDKMRMFTQTAVLSRVLELNIRNLFDILELNDTIPMTKIRLVYNNKDVIINKVYMGYNYSPMVNYRLPFHNTMAILLKLSDGRFIIITLFESGKYSIKVVWGENSNMTFDKTFDTIAEKVNILIDRINSLGRRVFNTRERLSLMEKVNSEFTELNINLFWRKIMIEAVFNKMLSYLRDYYTAGILQDKPGTSTEFFFYKGITKFDIRRLERGFPINNFYEHLVDPKIKQRWDFVFGKGRSVGVMHRSTDIRLDVQNIREKEFEVFYKYMLNWFYTTTQKVKPDEFLPKNVRIEVGRNRLKRLKNKDPVLYGSKNKGIGNLYSKKCQKPHQPIIYSPTEMMFLPEDIQKKSVKYWNFTTNSPAYYLCPDEKNPYLGFITGIHQDDYCVPCCKKADPTKAEASKKIHVYNICLDKKQYTEEDTFESVSRYIMSYGKEIEPERLGQPPKMISDFITFNTDIGAKSTDLLRSPNFYLIGVYQSSKIAENIGAVYALAQALKITPEKFVKNTALFIKNNLELFFNYRDYPLEEFIDLIDGNFVTDAPWNDIAIDAVKYQHNIYTLIIDDLTGEGSSFQMRLPEKLYYVEDLIPEKFEESERLFVILLRRPDKINVKKYLYYPLAVVTPRDFFKNGEINLLAFPHSNEIIELFRNMIRKLLKKPGQLTFNRIDLKIITQFVENTSSVQFAYKYVNMSDMCYGVLLKYKNKHEIYFPIDYSTYQKDDKLIKHGLFEIKKHKLSHKYLMDVVKLYNKYIISISTFKTSDGKTIPLYPLIEPKRFLVFDEKLIGFTCRSLYYYFNDGKKLIKNADIKIRRLKYHPDSVNKEITNVNTKIDNSELMQALYDRYLYDLFISHIIDYFEKSTNKPVRNKVLQIIRKTDYQNIQKIEEQLREILSKNDFIKIREELQTINGKKNFIKHFEKSSYDFDMEEYKKLLEMPADKLKDKIAKIANKIIIKKSPKLKSFDNIMSICGKEADYCKNNKLMVPPERFDSLLEGFANDIQNPIKRDYMLLQLFTKSVSNFAEFKKRPNETIYLDTNI